MGIMQKKIAIVIPCYNESKRLKIKAYKRYLEINTHVFILFVNDGSTDDTLEILKRITNTLPDNAIHINQERNCGKAESVRQGFLKAMELGFENVGYLDADLSAPLSSINRLYHLLEKENVSIVMGSRVRLSGRDVQRNPVRHYMGRIFATFASIVLNLSVYDTQCGAKVFNNNLELKRVFSQPFRVKWTFDVEILARFKVVKKILGGTSIDQSVYEYPLEQWHDIKGSKVRFLDFLIAALELFKIYAYLNFPIIKKRYADRFKK